MLDYRNLIKDREVRLRIIERLRFVPTKPYLRAVYFIKTGKVLHIDHPKTFCDKQNWLKIHEIHPEYTGMADKITARNYVQKRLGENICFPILGTWEHYKNINFDQLPDQFVLKCNHDSGSVKIIKDKSGIDHKSLETFFESRLKVNSYVAGREYPYKNIKPMIMAEKYMVPEGQSDIEDYKFFCFDGKPEILFVATDRSADCKFDFYDMDFNHLDIVNIHPQSGNTIPKPVSFEKMKQIAASLSKGIKFVRIDLYEIDGKVYFGEYTFFHAGGFWPLKPDEWEIELGNLIDTH